MKKTVIERVAVHARAAWKQCFKFTFYCPWDREIPWWFVCQLRAHWAPPRNRTVRRAEIGRLERRRNTSNRTWHERSEVTTVISACVRENLRSFCIRQNAFASLVIRFLSAWKFRAICNDSVLWFAYGTHEVDNVSDAYFALHHRYAGRQQVQVGRVNGQRRDEWHDRIYPEIKNCVHAHIKMLPERNIQEVIAIQIETVPESRHLRLDRLDCWLQLGEPIYWEIVSK